MLNSKKNILGWAIIFGAVATLISDILSETKDSYGITSISHGFPFQIYSYENLGFPFIIPKALFLNFIVWIFIAFLLLYLIYFWKTQHKKHINTTN